MLMMLEKKVDSFIRAKLTVSEGMNLQMKIHILLRKDIDIVRLVGK